MCEKVVLGIHFALFSKRRMSLVRGNRHQWKRRLPLCHPDRSVSGVEGSAAQRPFRGNVFSQNVGPARNGRYALSKKHFQERPAELQIPPLRYASVGMTKERAPLPFRFDARMMNSRSLHFAPPDFLWELVALVHFMRPSLRKGAHAVLSSAAWQEIRVRSGRDDTSVRSGQEVS